MALWMVVPQQRGLIPGGVHTMLLNSDSLWQDRWAGGGHWQVEGTEEEGQARDPAISQDWHALLRLRGGLSSQQEDLCSPNSLTHCTCLRVLGPVSSLETQGTFASENLRVKFTKMHAISIHWVPYVQHMFFWICIKMGMDVKKSKCNLRKFRALLRDSQNTYFF